MLPSDPELQRLAARVWASTDLRSVERDRAIRTVLGSERWAEIAWFLVQAISRINDSSRAELLAALADAIIARGALDDLVADTAHTILRQEEASEAAERLANWIIAREDPNEAPFLVTAVLASPTALSPDVVTRCMRWLVQWGSGELREPRNGPVCVKCAYHLARANRFDDAYLAYRLALSNDAPLSGPFARGVPDLHRTPAELLWLVHQLDERHPDEGFVEATLEKAHDSYLHELVKEMAKVGSRYAERVFRLAAAGRLAPRAAETVFHRAIGSAGQPVATEPLRSRSALAALVRALAERCSARAPGELDGTNWEPWYSLAVSSAVALEAHGELRNLSSPVLSKHPQFRTCLHTALLADVENGSLKDHPHRLEMASLLEQGSGVSVLEAVTLLADARAEIVRIQPAPATFGPSFANDLVRLLNAPGLDRTWRQSVGRIREVRLADPPDGSSIHLEDEKLTVATRDLGGLLGLSESLEAIRALVELYVVHELTHHVQKLGPKENVRRVRQTGTAGEMTLMHLDLGADHVAACELTNVRYPDKLLWLKGLQGRSLTAFPAGTYASSASVHRKSLRLLGLRVDWMLRKRGRLPRVPSRGYAFVDLAPLGGALSVFRCEGTFSLVGSTEIDQSGALLLGRAASKGISLADVDKALERLLDAADLRAVPDA